MEESENILTLNLDKILELNQGIFFSFSEAGKRLPVNTIKGFEAKDKHTILFYCNHFPVTEKAWNIFAAELYLFRKGVPFSMNLKGIGIIADSELGLVELHIQNVEYFEHPQLEKRGLFASVFQPYTYLLKKSTELMRGAGEKKVAI